MEQDGVSVVIRDTRKADPIAVRASEAFEMQYINAIRAATDIAKISDKAELSEALKTIAMTSVVRLKKNSEKSQTDLAEILKAEIKSLESSSKKTA